MALLRKKNPEWFPSENKGLLVGDTIEISDYRTLVEEGNAELVDEAGTVLPLPGTVFVCGICFEKCLSHSDYVAHVLKEHSGQTDLNNEKNTSIDPEEAEETAIEKDANPIKIPETFGQRMAKARAEAKAKREAEDK